MKGRVLIVIVVIIAAIAGLSLVSALWSGLWSWLPWSEASQLDRAETRADTAESEADARGLEAQGNAEQVTRTEAYGDIRIRVEGVTASAVTEARSAPDAETPLDPDRGARLRDHDRSLCQLAPASCAAPADAR